MKKLLTMFSLITLSVSPISTLISCNNPENGSIDQNLFDQLVTDAKKKLLTYLKNNEEMQDVLGTDEESAVFKEIYDSKESGKITNSNATIPYQYLFNNYEKFIISVNEELDKQYSTMLDSSSEPIKIESIKEFSYDPIIKSTDWPKGLQAVTINFDPKLLLMVNNFKTGISPKQYSIILTNNPLKYIEYMLKGKQLISTWLREYISSNNYILQIADNKDSSILTEFYNTFYVTLNDKEKNKKFDNAFIDLFSKYIPNGYSKPIEVLMKEYNFQLDKSKNLLDIKSTMSKSNKGKYAKSLSDDKGFKYLCSNINKINSKKYIQNLMVDNIYKKNFNYYYFGQTVINLNYFKYQEINLNGNLQFPDGLVDEQLKIGMREEDFDKQIDIFCDELDKFETDYGISIGENLELNFKGDYFSNLLWLRYRPFSTVFDKLITNFWNNHADFKPTSKKAGISFQIVTNPRYGKYFSNLIWPLDDAGKYGVTLNSSEGEFIYFSYGTAEEIEQNANDYFVFLLAARVKANVDQKVSINI